MKGGIDGVIRSMAVDYTPLSDADLRKVLRIEIRSDFIWHILALENIHDKDRVKRIGEKLFDAEDRLGAYKNSFRFRTKIRKYCNERLYTDVNPYEVVRVVSDKIVEVRPMHAEITKRPKEFHPGGFSGHYSDNYAQEYKYTSVEDAPIMRLHLSKQGWGRGRFTMSDKPRKFYDFNF